MTEGLKEGEGSGRELYPDIIDLPHWQSPTRPHMSLYKRAAQFAPFDALAGYTDMVKEDRRTTEKRRELDADELESLNRKLNGIAEVIARGENPTVTFTVFQPDRYKEGGSYATITDRVKKIDTVRKMIILMSKEGYGRVNRTISISAISAIQGDVAERIDEQQYL